MSYVWINPVVASMYDGYILDEFLRRFGHRLVEVKTDWGTIVKEKYRAEVLNSKEVIGDMRCPKIKSLLEDVNQENKIVMPDIHPILIHCGIELSKREDIWEEEKIITTPCQALADAGNSLGLRNTWFVPWNRFLESLSPDLLRGENENDSLSKSSPIPPGFFDELRISTVSLTGEDEIRDFFSEKIPTEIQLIELLYCKDGCHNGDGIRGNAL